MNAHPQLRTPRHRARAGSASRRGRATPLHRRRVAAVVPAVALLLLAGGCRISVSPSEPHERSGFHEDSDIAFSTQQIRLRARSLVDPMSGEVEAAADRIIATTDDPAIRRAAIEWKSDAVPALREALFQPDPLTAFFDTWVLTNQMAVYFSSGPGAASLGDRSGVALATSLKLERELNEVIASITKSGDVRRARDAARQWAAAHPITTRIAYRESTLTRALEIDLASELSAGETLASVTMTVDDLNRRLEIYADQLLRQVGWEAQVISMDLAEQFDLDEAMPLANRTADSVDELNVSVDRAADSVEVVVSSVEQVLPLLERLVAVAETAPRLVSGERTAAIASVQAEIQSSLQFVREERKAALQHVTAERLAALQTLHETIAEQRELLTADVETIGVAAIDHAFWRAAQLAAAVLVALFLAALAALFLARRMIAGLLRERAGAGSA